MLTRSDGRLIGGGRLWAPPAAPHFLPEQRGPKRVFSEKQVHAEPRRHPQGEHEREEDQRKLPLALRGRGLAQQVLRIYPFVRAHCSPSPSIEDRGEVPRALSASSTTSGALALPRGWQLRDGQFHKRVPEYNRRSGSGRPRATTRAPRAPPAGRGRGAASLGALPSARDRVRPMRSRLPRALRRFQR